tara:strand:- start:48 stop:599 length:552 start_codon:yes stop_codon:yes gene_type:complete
MAITKIQSESLNLADDYTFTGDIVGAGGITQADVQYYSGTNSISATTNTTLASWSGQTTSTFGNIGTRMTHSSGVWTFPTTGIYLVQLHLYLYVPSSDVQFVTNNMYGTLNNGSSWTSRASDDISIKLVGSAQTYTSNQLFCQFDCTDTSTDKMYFAVYGTSAFKVANNQTNTYASFIRLGDT